MKYIKSYKLSINEKIDNNIKDHIKDNIIHMLLPVSDDDLQIFIGFNYTLSIQISGFSYDGGEYKVFTTNDYIDEIERVIDYLKDKGYTFSEYFFYEAHVNKKTINIYNESDYKRKIGDCISDVWNKKSIGLTMFFQK